MRSLWRYLVCRCRTESYDTSGNSGAGYGYKTNWIFTDGVGTTGPAVGQATAHENGHGLSLSHQSDYTGDTYVNEYSLGDNNGGNGTYAPIMALPITRNAALGGWAIQHGQFQPHPERRLRDFGQ